MYARISLDPAGLRAGVERQEQDCRAEIARRGWALAPEHVFVDNDVSAYRGKSRPAYEALLKAIESKEIRAVVTWAPDRLTRYMPELEALIGLIERTGCQVATIQGGDWDLTTPEGRFSAGLMGRLARLEAEKTGARVSRARLEAAKQGLPSPGGQKAWGFQKDRMTHDVDEVAQIRDVAQRILAGESVRSASMRHGKRPKDVKRALLSPRMVGLRDYKGTLYPAAWEPILDRNTWEALRTVLSANNRDRIAGVNPRKYLLSGFIYCGVCENRCFGFHRRRCDNKAGIFHDYWRYECHPGGCVTKRMDRVDDRVRDWLLPRLDVPDVNPEVDPALAAAVTSYEIRLGEAKEMWKRGSLTSAEYEADKLDLEARAQQARADLLKATADVEETGFTLTSTVGDTDIIQAVWDQWHASDPRQKRLLIAKHIDRVILHRTPNPRQFDPATVEIVPKSRNG
jgi:site-specific DNA recombinase